MKHFFINSSCLRIDENSYADLLRMTKNKATNNKSVRSADAPTIFCVVLTLDHQLPVGGVAGGCGPVDGGAPGPVGGGVDGGADAGGVDVGGKLDGGKDGGRVGGT